ncbi:MAG: methyl-accepting chemotaxis protein [Rhodospirillales bacterium]
MPLPFLNRLRIGGKLIAGFVTLTVLTLGLGFYAIYGMASMDRATAQLRDNHMLSLMHIGRIGRGSERLRAQENRAALDAGGPNEAIAISLVSEADAALSKARADYDSLVDDGWERENMTKLDTALADYRQSADSELLRLIRKGDIAGAKALQTGSSLQKFSGLRSLITADLDYNEHAAQEDARASEAAYTSTRSLTLAALAFTTFAAIAIAWLLVRDIAHPLVGMRVAMDKLAAGDLTVAVPGAGRADEVGGMAQAVEVFKRGLVENRRMVSETEAAVATRTARAARVDALVVNFQAQAGQSATTMGHAVSGLEGAARSMSANADDTNQRAAAAAGAASQAGAGIQSVAASAEQLAASIGEISRQVAQSAQMTGDAVQEAQRSSQIVQALAESASRIGQVVEMINGIAGQTNLLALNATIEAARAGEAGRGFAVVASEVKTLAGQTAKATGDIGEQIAQIQAATGHAVQAIQAMTKQVEQISGVATTIAAAVEEQGVATAEIARNVQQTSQGAQAVSANMDAMRGAAQEVGATVTQVVTAAASLGSQSTAFSKQIEVFLAAVRAA